MTFFQMRIEFKIENDLMRDSKKAENQTQSLKAMKYLRLYLMILVLILDGYGRPWFGLGSIWNLFKMKA